jgi:hypothetical protein
MIGIPEEFTKLIPVLVAVLLFKPKEPTDYILYAATSALGFAFVENLLYSRDITNGIIHGRAYLAVIAHMVASSIVVYGFILARFRKKNTAKAWTLVPLTFLAGSTMHGVYDFMLFHSWFIPFFLVFIFTVQVWIIIINNGLNNVSNFSYRTTMKADRLKIFIAVSLTSIFALEYLLAGFKMGADLANTQLIQNAAFAGFFIIFFSSNLSSFNLIRGYWRDVYFSSREKRGYGTMAPRNVLSSWYFVNSIQPHNYVGLKVLLYNDPYNRNLEDVLEGKMKGTIVNRIILYDGKDQDPHWFILKLDSLLHIDNYHPRYMLVKPRHESDSLEMDGELQVFFKVIKDPELLRTARPQKEAFPFLGWTYLELATK